MSGHTCRHGHVHATPEGAGLCANPVSLAPGCNRCAAQEWVRDGRGLWAMRECTGLAKHGGRHSFSAWRYDAKSPSSDHRRAQNLLNVMQAIATETMVVLSDPHRTAEEYRASLMIACHAALNAIEVARPMAPQVLAEMERQRDELLAALQLVLPDFCASHCSGGLFPGDAIHHVHECATACAAIAKAEGK